MKNIHVLPTSQPSRLYKHEELGFKLLAPVEHEIGQYNGSNQHIYITSNKEIKERDWYLDTFKNEIRKAQLNLSNDKYKKIILTTDPTLIADGVQAIGDEFLEWFVKNSSCEFINVEKEELKSIYNDFTTEGNGIYLTPKNTPLQTNETLIEDNIISYKIIIPQEEPKQDCFSLPNCTCQEPDFDTMKGLCNVCGNSIIHLGKRVTVTKQETLEEVAERLHPVTMLFDHNSRSKHNEKYDCNLERRNSFIEGANYQAEKMYSEEEVLELLWKREWSYEYSMPFITVDQWFEQFKKK
jgi:hypothetical protein